MSNWDVLNDESGLSLAHFLKKQLSFSSKKIKELIDSGSVSINGRIEKFSNYKLAAGQKVFVNLKQKYSFKNLVPLYEDETIVIYNKPPFISSEEFASQFNHLILLHRLDKDTSGALLFAKTEEEYSFLMQLFKNRKINKTYLAIVEGNLKGSFNITNYLGIKSQKNGKIIMESKDDESKKQLAITDFEVICLSTNYSLLLCKPKTGRTHQIRVHLSELGYPILGDDTYSKGLKEKFYPNRLMLHALSLEFTSSKNIKIFIQAPLFQDIKEALQSTGLVGHKLLA